MRVTSGSKYDEDACCNGPFANWCFLRTRAIGEDGEEAETGCSEEGGKGCNQEGDGVERG